MRNEISPEMKQSLGWHNADVPGEFAFQRTPRVTRHDFDPDANKIEGEWTGLYSTLNSADFEGLRERNPAVLELTRTGHLRDWIEPIQFHIKILETNQNTSSPNANDGITVTGDGVCKAPLTINGKVRPVYLPSKIMGEEKSLNWRISFRTTYVDGTNGLTFYGVYCPGIRPLLIS